MGVESYVVLWVFTGECCHPNRFRVELMLIESFEIGRLGFPNRDTLKFTHCFLPNETKMSDGGRGRALIGVKVWKLSQKWSVQRSAVRSIA
jgi:hypothetical protein